MAATVIDLVPALQKRAGEAALLALRQGLHARATWHHNRLNNLYVSVDSERARWAYWDEELGVRPGGPS